MAVNRNIPENQSPSLMNTTSHRIIIFLFTPKLIFFLSYPVTFTVSLSETKWIGQCGENGANYFPCFCKQVCF